MDVRTGALWGKMEFLYFAILIIGVLIGALFFYNKTKKTSSVYITRENAGEDFEDEEESDITEVGATNIPEFGDYKIEILYYWISQKVHRNDNIDYDILKEKLIQNFQTLLEILEDSTSFVQEDQNALLKEVLGRVDYSTPVKFFVINKGRKISSWLKTLLLVLGIICFIFFQIEIRRNSDEYSFCYLLLAVSAFLLSFPFAKFAEKFLFIMVKTLTPGDCIKIISEPDEIIERKVKINQLSSNESVFNKTSIFFE